MDCIIARAHRSPIGLGEPIKKDAYNIAHYERQDLQALALLLVSAHEAKYDLVSVFAAALEEVAVKSDSRK